MKTILITGASSGIGKAIAQKCMEEGHRVYGLARRTDRLKELESTHPDLFKGLACDVTRVGDIQSAKAQIAQAGHSVDVVVNNAGVGYLGDLKSAKLEEWHAMMDVNVKGLLSVTHTFLSDLRTNKGQLINIDSVAGHEVYSTAVVYCASKWAVKAISMGMEKEFRGEIKITNISPGAVETEFVEHTTDEEKKAEMKSRFKDVLTGEDIADAVAFALNQRERSAINEITIRPWK